ncbi:MAG: hypothetical protein NZ772_10800 [Cyanobacteria bacterium]|nr:hypothetical protein [Cyanobacteriota bacterium]MDW8201793.1 hypothetical protein [Cyanobacteriota bacterium SKYGB_h_bin112]
MNMVNLHQPQPAKPEIKLTPTTTYYIRKLFQNASDEVKNSVLFRVGLAAGTFNDVMDLDSRLQALYPDEIDVLLVVQQLEDLVALHKTLKSQTGLYSSHEQELARLEERIFQLLF